MGCCTVRRLTSLAVGTVSFEDYYSNFYSSLSYRLNWKWIRVVPNVDVWPLPLFVSISILEIFESMNGMVDIATMDDSCRDNTGQLPMDYSC
jgi:hypothetical protein